MNKQITKEDFKDFKSVRDSGRTNMFDVDTVVDLSDGLTAEKCQTIMRDYSKLKEQFAL